jgi:hypothetical protein
VGKHLAVSVDEDSPGGITLHRIIATEANNQQKSVKVRIWMLQTAGADRSGPEHRGKH